MSVYHGASGPDADEIQRELSAIHCLYGLLLSGQIRFRRINGWQKLKDVIEKSKKGELMLKAS